MHNEHHFVAKSTPDPFTLRSPKAGAMSDSTTHEEPTSWHDAVAEFLTDLTAVQEALLAEVGQRHKRSSDNREPLGTVTAAEVELLNRLAECHQRRAELLHAAHQAGLPAQSLRAAVAALGNGPVKGQLSLQIAQAASTGRRLQLAGLTQWMLAQRSLAHVGQVLEILATGAPQPPTYGNGAVSTRCGGLLDQAA
jgi:hypothetical protein